MQAPARSPCSLPVSAFGGFAAEASLTSGKQSWAAASLPQGNAELRSMRFGAQRLLAKAQWGQAKWQPLAILTFAFVEIQSITEISSSVPPIWGVHKTPGSLPRCLSGATVDIWRQLCHKWGGCSPSNSSELHFCNHMGAGPRASDGFCVHRAAPDCVARHINRRLAAPGGFARRSVKDGKRLQALDDLATKL